MLGKIKNFIIKNKTLVIIGIIIILVVLILVLFFLKKESKDIVLEKPSVDDSAEIEGDYQLSIADDVSNEIEGLLGTYSTFYVKDVNHLEWVQKFVSATKGRSVSYTEKPHPAIPGHPFHTIDQTTHYWTNDEDSLSYDVSIDVLSFYFEKAVNIQGVSINPRTEETMLKGLKEISAKFFSEDFEFRVDEISRVGNNYKVEYSRLLENMPINRNFWDLYLLITPDGRLKEGMFLLAEFEKVSEVSIASSEEVKEKIYDQKYPKSVDFGLLSGGNGKIDDYYGYTKTGKEIGEANLESVKLEYRYYSKFDELIEPYFFFEGIGYFMLDDEKIDTLVFVEST